MKKSLIALIALAALAASSGCSSLSGQLEMLDNRLVTTVDGERAFVNSLYGPIGISSELSKKDAAALRRLREGDKSKEEKK